eukprot:GHVL01018232.1.p1 GENE.GHVL01018232.1~~GHVL01018232.1.p1  ORF type:complete len:331 (-),score=31.14 GHVL01018232.1:630-1622(-)
MVSMRRLQESQKNDDSKRLTHTFVMGASPKSHHPLHLSDINWGFWSIPLEEESKKYAAMITHRGTFEFNVLPFGIKNSPGAFQRVIDIIFGDLYTKGVSVYIDDIVIYQNSEKDSINTIHEVLQRCKSNGLYIKLKKSHILKAEIPLLGHMVSKCGISPQPERVMAIVKAKRPDSVKTLRAFLGTVGFLRNFVPQFARIAAKDDEARRLLRKEYCNRALLQLRLMEEKYHVSAEKKVEIGDWIVYSLSDYEKRKDKNIDEAMGWKYTMDWSLPYKVIKNKGNAVIAHAWGDPSRIMQIPVTKLAKLRGIIPDQLAKYNKKGILLRKLRIY